MLLVQEALAQTTPTWFAVKMVANDYQQTGSWAVQFSVVGINNFDHVAGSVQGTVPGKWSDSDGCIWREGRLVTLASGSVYAPPPFYGGIDGTNFSSLAISDNGVALGVFSPWHGSPQSVLLSEGFSPSYQFFLTNLAANASAKGYAIDNEGRVAGVLATPDGSGSRVEGFVWAGGKLNTFGPLAPGENLHVNAMNNHGDVVGDSGARAFVWRNGTLTDLNQLLAANSGWQLQSAKAINDHGQITGNGLRNGQVAGFLFVSNSIADLGLSGTNIAINALNNRTQIVGQVDGKPFLWENGQAADLNALIPADASWQLQTAVDINDLGCIVGSGLVPPHWELLTGYSSNAVYELIPAGALAITGSGWSANGTFQLRYLQKDSTAIVLQATTDFVRWMDVATNRPPMGLAMVSDPNPAASANRYYRLRRSE
jgi:hypothetical protein